MSKAFFKSPTMHFSKTKSPESVMEEGISRETVEPYPSPYNLAELDNVAEFLNVDGDFWVFRRFGKLHLLNILVLQQRLRDLEYTLRQQILRKQTRNFPSLQAEIRVALEQYDAALSSQARSRSYGVPEDHIIDHMTNWIDLSKVNSKPLEDVLHKRFRKDIVSIAGVEKTWTHKFIDRHGSLRSLFAEDASSEPWRGSSWTNLVYPEKRVRQAEEIVLHASFCVLLLCPTIAMSYMHNQIWKWVLLGLFLCAASVLSVGFLNAPNKTGLAFVAGYAAILVVFSSNTTGSQ